jgi:hypothetical protein
MMSMTVNGLSAAMEAELPRAWEEVKGFPLPAGGDPADRRVLFRAIARGLLRYLLEHQTDFLESITFSSFTVSSTPASQTVDSVDFDITALP